MHPRKPVYPGYFADPSVFRHEDIYYAVGTGVIESVSETGRAAEALTVEGKPGVFLMLRSKDFVEWMPVGSALETLADGYGNAYWAPEIAFHQGQFYMYYSVGREDKGHHLRVAMSSAPEGPYRDCGARVTDPFTCPFAIDASPFQDDDGQWYLFYATDFLDSSHSARAGTGVVVDRLQTMTQLAGEPQVVYRAEYDWQRFLNDRVMYGGVHDWHTIEGPCVRKHGGKYYCLFSAGRWENSTYGVDWVVADQVMGPYRSTGDGTGARLLRTIAGDVVGPGHNSIATGPDGRDYIVYHAWDAQMTARRMFIDALEWAEEGPRVSARS